LKTGIKIVLICCITFVSCNKSTTKQKLIDENDMARILMELQYTESKINRLNVNGSDSSRIAYKYLENKIFKNYKTDSQNFAESYDFYAQDKKKLYKIYSSAEDLLQAKKDSLNNKNK
jgi:hypothetical protein